MTFNGAAHYFFWLGIKAAVYRLCDDQDMGPNLGSTVQERCLDGYVDGFMIGLELTTEEYKELIDGI